MTHLLSVQQFRDAIAKGLGRAYLHVRRYGDAGVKEEIRRAVMRDLTYDPQCEEDRSEYIYRILKATGRPEEYIPDIIQGANRRAKWWKKEYTFELLGAFAREGNLTAKAAIRRGYAKWDPDRMDYGPLLDAEGLDGLLTAAGILGKHLPSDGPWIADMLLDDAGKRFGRKKTEEAVFSRAKHDSNMRRFRRLVAKYRREMGKPLKPRPIPNLQQVIDGIEHTNIVTSSPMLFAQRAPKRDIELLYERMLEQNQTRLVWRYLHCFGHGGLPQLDEKLFNWARSRNRDIHHFANLALSNVKAKAVRDFALERLTGGHKPDWAALQLLKLNYQKGDGDWLLPLLHASDEPAQQRHGIAMDICEISKANRRDVSLKHCLRWAYEHTPCSLCRRRSIRQLLRLHGVTLQLLHEAQFDADSHVRNMAGKALLKRRRS